MVSSVRPPGRPRPVPPKHVIDVYRHRDQHVTCICGWQGSSAPRPIGSDWGDHVALMRRTPSTGERQPAPQSPSTSQGGSGPA